MAVWDGVPYHKVLRDVILRELSKGPRTLDEISEDVVLNGEHPKVDDLAAQMNYLQEHRHVKPERYSLA